jgi:hypothetical protein
MKAFANKAHNKSLHSDVQKRRYALLLRAGEIAR